MTRQPFDLVGTGRSGTTYLYSILREHPRIALTNESKLFDFFLASAAFARIPAYELDAAMQLRGMVNRACIPDFGATYAEFVPRVLEAFYERHFREKSFTHWGDKMVSLTSPEELQRLFPTVRCLVPVRDPRDVICSWRAAIAYQPFFGEYSLRSFAEMWARTYDGIRVHLRRRHVVRYEELVRDPRRVVRDALAFLDLDFDPACERAVASNDTFPSFATSASPAASVGRWKRELDADDLRTVEEVCARQMDEFGYVLSTRAEAASDESPHERA